MPEELKQELKRNSTLNTNFETLSPYKQKEYCEYIASAK
ncbi:MAG: YdeI/OmpD-associated family protein [Flavobacteriaceae bacterium]